MKFIDQAVIKITAGNGGKGCVSFRREKYVPRGGPDGGNGGKGGDVVLEVKDGLTTLMDLQYKKSFDADRGRGGKGKGQDGRGGDDVILHIPPGTVIYDHETGACLGDLTHHAERLVVAKGGRGGKGNAFFTTSTHQAPRFAQDGEEGEKRMLRLELKLLADVGLVGMPNAGKSTFLTLISKARPKVADYPFTTLNPVLGVVSHKSYPPFTVADIPGLIEGAHEGQGLGDEFLKHIERTSLLLHLVSLSPEELDDPLTRYEIIRKELLQYDPNLKKKTVIIVLTKVDLLDDPKALKSVVAAFKKKKLPVFVVSAPARKGVDELLDTAAKKVQDLRSHD